MHLDWLWDNKGTPTPVHLDVAYTACGLKVNKAEVVHDPNDATCEACKFRARQAA